MDKIKNSFLADAVYEKIKQMIVDGDLVPGSKISKKEIAKSLAVSLTPVNEAISRLSGEKLVKIVPKEGIYIRDLNDQDLAEIYAIRAGLESVAARICALEAKDSDIESLAHFFSKYNLPIPSFETKEYMMEDQSFHTTILRIARIPMLVDLQGFYGFMIKSYEHGLMRPPNDTLSEHKAIIKAIQSRNAKAASELMMEHHLKSRNRIISMMKANQ